MNKMYYVRTNGEDYIVVNHNNEFLRVVDERPNGVEFPYLCNIERSEWEKVAIKFMESIEDDTAFEVFDVEELNNLLGYNVPNGHDTKEIIAEIDCDWL